MKVWKVILATVVIFIAGALAGGMWVKRSEPDTPMLSQRFFQERLKRELHLDADQTNRIDKIFADSNARIKILLDLVSPEIKKERQEVRDNIRAILTPEQRERFEQLLKEPPRHPDPRRGPRSGTNGTNSPKILKTNNDVRVE